MSDIFNKRRLNSKRHLMKRSERAMVLLCTYLHFSSVPFLILKNNIRFAKDIWDKYHNANSENTTYLELLAKWMTKDIVINNDKTVVDLTFENAESLIED
jgi:hypothetical protein